ncbi:MAG: BatD family protein [Candidatus Cloacimonadales bacterium]
MIKKLLYFTLIFCFASLLAADISFESYVDKTSIGVQDRLQLTLEISGSEAGKVPVPDLPDLPNFANLGYSSSSSSSYSFSNGRAESTVTKKYTYTLQPQSTGKYIIPPLQIKYSGQTYTTKPISIEVASGSTTPAPPTSRNLSTSERNDSGSLSENLFLKANVSQTKVYQDQPLTVEYVLYSRYEISNLAFGEDSGYQGFWKEDLYLPDQINFRTKTENGKRYNTMLMKKVLLFPRESGSLEIPALQIEADIRTQSRSFFDFGSSKSYTLKSKPQKIEVDPLPPAPEKFSGAVGKFQIESRISSNQLEVGDSFTYSLEISGSGNVKNFSLPQLPETKHLRFLDPETSTEMNSDGISGKRVIKYLVIAREQGKIEIPPLAFTYFDVEQKKYLTRKTASYTLQVTAGDMAYIPSSRAQMAVQMEGSDIGFLVDIENLKQPKILYKSWLYWLIFIFLLLTIPLSFVYRKEQDKLSSNQDYQRTKQAKKILKKYLKEATTYASQNKIDFYASAQAGLSNYLADKLHVARGSTTATLLEELQKQAVPQQLFEQIKNLNSSCNQARFMPGGFSDQQISQDLASLKHVVNELSKIKFK